MKLMNENRSLPPGTTEQAPEIRGRKPSNEAINLEEMLDCKRPKFSPGQPERREQKKGSNAHAPRR